MKQIRFTFPTGPVQVIKKRGLLNAMPEDSYRPALENRPNSVHIRNPFNENYMTEHIDN